MDEPDDEGRMIDATHLKAADAMGGHQAMSRIKGGLDTRIHLAVDSHGMPVRMRITGGTTADGTQAA